MAARSADRPVRVLVVERDETLRHSTAAVLAQAGYDVQVAADVASATGSVLHLCPDLALVHVGLPDGWGLVRALRSDARTRGCPIVATGGRPLGSYAHEPMLAEVEGYLQKPVDPEFLLAVIVGALSGGGVAERATRDLRALADEPGGETKRGNA